MTPRVLANLEKLGAGFAGGDWRRRYAQLCGRAEFERLQGCWDSEDDGQRRAEYRILYWLFDRYFAGDGGDSAAADDGGLTRADWHFSRVWARCRLYGAVHGLCDVDPLRHSGV